MNPFRKIRDAFRRDKAQKVTQELANQLFVNPLCSDYENVFSQVRPLINDMAVVRPYGVGRNGGRLDSSRTPELILLNSPNNQMGWFDFASTMFATWLTEDELDIRVHFGRGNHIIGYTILPAGSRNYDGRKYTWQVDTKDGIEIIEEDEVMRLFFSRSPKNLYRGVSPATSVRAWAQTEDVLAQYQRAFIENGAIPASITFIRASSYEKFEEAQNSLEKQLRGAKNKNKTIYIWRQYDNDSGVESDQVEIKTIQGNNSTLAIKELSDIINDHLNKAYGVSNFILGDDSSAKYDNAELSDYQFIKRRVYPALLAFWSQFQHELDRITGGLGYAIQFDIELPDLTERKKVKAETAEKNVGNLIRLIDSGSKPDLAVKALELDDSWIEVARGIYQTKLTAVSQTNSVKKTAGAPGSLSQDENEHSSSFNVNSTTKKLPNSTAVSEKDALPKMNSDEIKIYNLLIEMARKIMEEDSSLNEAEIMAKINETLEEVAVRGAEEGSKALELLANEDVKAEIQAQVKEGLKVSEALRGRISERVNELVNNYGEETRRLFNETLEANKDKPASEIRKALREVMPTYQAERIARNETVYAERSGRLEQDKAWAERYGLNVRLVWRARHDSETCDLCASMDGQTVALGEAYADSLNVPAGTELVNGKTLEEDTTFSFEHTHWNDDGQIPEGHVNCRCYFDEEII